jgi:hypothetical protein
MTITIRIDRRTILAALTVALMGVMFALHLQVGAASGEKAANPTPVPCPPSSDTQITAASVLRLERGYMFWFGNTSSVYVLYYTPGSTSNGTYEVLPDTWKDGMPESDGSINAPQGLSQPKRGFGKVWLENQRIRDGLGWGLSESSGYMAVITKQGNKIWFNGRDEAFQIVDNRWEAVYAWRK